MKRLGMTALAVVLLAQSAPAMAQDRGGRGERGDRAERAERMEQRRDRPHRDGERARPQWRGDGGQRAAPQAPRAAEAPRAPDAARADRPRFRGDGAWTRDRDDGRRGDRDGARDRRDGDRRDGDRGRRDGNRDWDGRRDHDRRDWDGRRDRRDWDRRDGRRDDHRRWERGRYPSVYFSPHRYRHQWRAPTGFYVHLWSYGDYLPRGWWGPNWWLVDPWYYDLPLPPPGFQWVRAGDDALLVDEFTGRIVQVVRNVFW